MNICKLKICLGLFLVLLVACNAPRKNPLDPQNPNAKFATISGNVYSVSVPNTAISNVAVYWQNADFLSQTDGAGKFTIRDFTPQNGWLVFSKENYFTDSVWVAWNGRNEFNTRVHLNKKPVLDSLALFSVTLNEYSKRTFQVVIKAAVNDSDNDIDSLLVVNNSLNFSKELRYNITDRMFESTLRINDFDSESLHEIVGYDFVFWVKDTQGHSISIGRDRLKRVILDPVEIISPAEHNVVSSRPVLKWSPYNAPFSFKYDIQIYTQEIIPSLVWEMVDIPSDSLSVAVEEEQEAGTYFWIIWAIDAFGNRVRSKPASFTVE